MKKKLLTCIALLVGGHLFAQSTALHFDGVDDYVKITGHTDLSGPKTITIESWINVDNFSSSPCSNCAPLVWHQGGSYRFGTGNARGLHFDLSDGSGTQTLNITSAVLKDSVWHHVAATFDGAWMRIYLDGNVLDSLKTKFQSIGYSSSTTDVWIGDPATGYGGIAEETRIWNYARSTKEIREGMITSYDKTFKGLLLQLSYEDGIPYKDNTKVKGVTDLSGLGNNGSLENFAQKDSTSNFVLGLSYCDTAVYGSLKVNACEQFRMPSGRRIVTKSGNYSDTIRSYQGCDSIIDIEVKLRYNTTGKLTVVTCDSFKSLADKTLVYRKSGVYQERIPNFVGCDSIINIYLTITHPSEKTFKYRECGSVILNGTGKKVSKSGIYIDTFIGWGGCDSIIIHEVEILQNSSATANLNLCSFVACPTDKNVVYKQPGIYYDTIKNVAGCDSLITYNVISAKTTGETDIIACKSFKSPSGNATWTESGTYRDTLYGGNYKACDSFVVINLTVIKPQNAQKSVTACESYTSPGGKRVTTSGKIFETYKSQLGCDSIIQTIDVTIVNIDLKINRDWNTLISASKDASGAKFQWLDCQQNLQKIDGETSAEFAASGNGEYAVEITQGSCIDTSRCMVFAFTSKEEMGKTVVQVYPNPNDGNWQLQLTEPIRNARVTIWDATGKLIWESFYENLESKAIETNLQTGMYTVLITGDEVRYALPLMIK